MLLASHSGEGVCYASVVWRRHVALRLLDAAERLFVKTTVIRDIHRLSGLDLATRRGQISFSRRLSKLDPPVLDAVRIVCCFENLFKARLLLSGAVVHEIDKNVCPSLASQQRKRPVLIRQVKAAEGLLGKRDIDYSFRCLQPTTIRWHVMAGEAAYRKRIGVPQHLWECLKDIAARRNTLHFLALQMTTYNVRVFDELAFILNSFNRFVVGGHNRLLARSGHHARELLKFAPPLAG
jgi:hypothetical protein